VASNMADVPIVPIEFNLASIHFLALQCTSFVGTLVKPRPNPGPRPCELLLATTPAGGFGLSHLEISSGSGGRL
jgi:hypothetical protein